MIRFRNAVPLTCTFLIAFALGAFTVRNFTFNGNLSSIWPVNAVLLAQLLGRPTRGWWPFVLTFVCATMLAGTVARGMPLAAFAFACNNATEAVLAAVLLRRDVGLGAKLLHTQRSVIRFLLCAGFVSAINASISALLALYLFSLPLGHSLLTKFAADALGLAIFTPFFHGLFQGGYAQSVRGTSTRHKLHAVAYLAAVALVSTIIFSQDSNYPLLFVPLVPLMIVAFRTGWLGTSLAVMMVAVIGGIATFVDHGPIATASPNVAHQLALLQFYLAVVLCLMLPVSAALAARRDLIERVSESERSLKMLAERSAIVLLRLCGEGTVLRIVGDSQALVGTQAELLLGAHIAELPGSLGEHIFAAHLEALSTQAVVTIEIERPGGVWVEATFRADTDEAGRPNGTSATFMEVTARKLREGELALLAETDALTGLTNRAGFLRRFDHALESPAPISLALIDVDRFKLLNDQRGHLAGDAVLAEIARRIHISVRSDDLVARLGGDEFVVLLRAADPGTAREICRRIVENVSGGPIVLPLGGQVSAQISCGVVHRASGQTGTELLNRADIALYEAKRGGRNKLVAA